MPKADPAHPVSSFRLSPEERAMLRDLAASLGLSNTATLRLAIRDLGRRQLGSPKTRAARCRRGDE